MTSRLDETPSAEKLTEGDSAAPVEAEAAATPAAGEAAKAPATDEAAKAPATDEAANEKALTDTAAGSSKGASSIGQAPGKPVDPNTHVTVIQDPDDPDMVIIRTRKRKRKKRSKESAAMNPRLRIALIVAAVVAGIVAAAGTAFAIAVNVGNVNLHQVLGGLQDVPESATVQDEGHIVEYDGHTYRYNENIVSFLLIGHDDESAFATRPNASCADINVLIAIDTSTNKVRAVVVPRDSWVPVDIYDEAHNYVETRDLQLTLAHAVLLDTTAECAANTTKSVSRVFYNLPINYYVDIDQRVVKEASHAVGGVQVQALESIPGEGYEPGDTVLLEGDSALKYVQYRDVNVLGSAITRQERQIQFVKAFAEKAASIDAQGLLGLYNSISSDITTNLGPAEIAYLASCFATGGNAGMEVSTLVGRTEVVAEADGKELERYYLDETSVMENTLATFYMQMD